VQTLSIRHLRQKSADIRAELRGTGEQTGVRRMPSQESRGRGGPAAIGQHRPRCEDDGCAGPVETGRPQPVVCQTNTVCEQSTERAARTRRQRKRTYLYIMNL